MRDPLFVLRSSTGIYSSLTCSPLFPTWLFLTTSGSSQPHSLFHSTCGRVQESWMSMLVQCRWTLCFIAQLQAIKWLNHIMLFCITVPSFSSVLSICSFRLLPPAVLSSLNNSAFVCVSYRYQCVGGFVFWGFFGGSVVVGVFWFCFGGFAFFWVLVLSFGFLLKIEIWVWESVFKFLCESWDRKQISTTMNALHLRG